jgi:hypothetical protein
VTLYTNIRLNARLIARIQIMTTPATITRPMGMTTITLLTIIRLQ